MDHIFDAISVFCGHYMARAVKRFIKNFSFCVSLKKITIYGFGMTWGEHKMSNFFYFWVNNSYITHIFNTSCHNNNLNKQLRMCSRRQSHIKAVDSGADPLTWQWAGHNLSLFFLIMSYLMKAVHKHDRSKIARGGVKGGEMRGTIALELFLTVLCNNPPIWARSDQLR